MKDSNMYVGWLLQLAVVTGVDQTKGTQASAVLHDLV